MSNLPKITALLVAFSTAGLSWVLQSGAQESAPTNNQEKAQTESSLLIEPPANSASNAPSPKAGLPTNAETASEGEVLPPPQRPRNEPMPRQSNRLARRQPFLRPTEPEPSEAPNLPPPAAQPLVAEEDIPAPDATDAMVRPTPPISTDTDRDARRMYRDSGEVELVMVVKNPADGCLYEIPLCVPACCTGEPTMEEWRGLFGRGVVEYCWECGFTATVKFRHILGDVKVEYDG